MHEPWDLSDPDERDLAAGEYALGTLDAEQRVAFEALLAVSPELQGQVARWREHLQILNDRLEPVAPPAALWPRIAQTAGLVARPWLERLGLWRSLTAACATLALAFGVLWYQAPGDGAAPGSAVYVVLDEARVPGWIISASEQGELTVQAVQPSQVGEEQTGELWLIADGTPVSLGLLPGRGRRTLSPRQDLRERLMTADLAVSVEPKGGAPQGRPTGPIIDHGRLTPVRGGTLSF